MHRALPKHMDADRLARLALTVVRQSDIEAHKARKPENSLARCTPESFAGALLTAAALGLEPGVNQEAYLVPYKGECTLIVGYQGFAKLFWQHPLAKHLDAHAVHAKDDFDYAYGLAQYLRHKPAKGERGKITHYYAVAELSTGASAFVVLTADEVKKLRGGKVGPSGNIPDPMHWMERKTALRQLVKLLPKSRASPRRSPSMSSRARRWWTGRCRRRSRRASRSRRCRRRMSRRRKHASVRTRRSG
jgi:recombination protein RecT